MIKNILFALLVFLPFVFAQDCTPLIDAMVVNQPTFLCRDKYHISQGIVLDGADVVLDCQGSTLIGDNTSIAVIVKSDDAAVRHCTFEGFKTAVYVDDSIRVQLARNAFVSNLVGINARLSSYFLKENEFVGNLIDVSNDTIDFSALQSASSAAQSVESASSVQSSAQESSSQEQAVTAQIVKEVPEVLVGSSSNSLPNSIASSIFFVKIFVIVIVIVAVVLFFYSELTRE